MTPTPAATPGPDGTPTPAPDGTPAPTPVATVAAATPTPAAVPTPTPGAAPAIPTLSLALASTKVGKSGKVTARVQAKSATPRAIAGTITLTQGKRTVAKAKYKVAARGTRSARITLRLSASARSALAQDGTLSPLARITIVDAGTTIRSDFTRLRLRRSR